MSPRVDLKLRLWCNGEIALGPGKAELLAAIAHTGSISAAARSLEMSYRRAWLLVDTMNRCFTEPLVVTLAGGKRGGGAQVTAAGQDVLTRYRRMQDKAKAAISADLEALSPLLKSSPSDRA
ncbi:winged helix-turn-helix domain-containing protein [Herbaspirillum sp. ST 5-3]|uniref:winged helix-turn-helix domain-containing protein n=1 Tax=Oxalobacteraceae TaxID=75682 RepID=UPI0010A30E4E|nr:winged helix-turn-helix domain-containing protein [Herbaspirillum sp. ST 5-3]